MTISRVAALLVMLLVVFPGLAHADFMLEFFPNKCESCYGGTYTLSFVGDNSGSTFQVTLTIATTSDPNSVVFGQYITAVGFGDGKQIASVTPVSASVGGTWSTVISNINSSGACDGPPPAVFVCSQQNSNTPPFQLAQANGGVYSWTWIVTFQQPGLNLNLADFHIGAQYQDAGGSNGHITSETGLAAPEPATATMLGFGLLLLGFKLRRKSRV